VIPGHLSLERLIDALTSAPAHFLKMPIGRLEAGLVADLTIADLNGDITITADSMLSKSENTPFLGHTLQGMIVKTMCEGQWTWDAQ
jgi:dihydroorotase